MLTTSRTFLSRIIRRSVSTQTNGELTDRIAILEKEVERMKSLEADTFFIALGSFSSMCLLWYSHLKFKNEGR